jgi:hypothetical protein
MTRLRGVAWVAVLAINGRLPERERRAMRRSLAWSSLLLTIVLAGCTGTASPADTGAERVARAYYEAIIRKDWDRAFGVVENKAPGEGKHFAIQAERFRRRLGFEPDEVVIRSCGERGDEATAHVLLRGRGHLCKDTVVLHKANGTWQVVLPPRFGEQR